MTKEVFQNLQKLVHWVSNRKLPGDISSHDREDAVQDAFVAILEAGSRADPKKNLRALVNIRLRGALKDFMKKKAQSCRYCYNDTVAEETMQQQDRTLESKVTCETLALQTRVMMYGLEERQRQAVESYYLESRNIEETAESLGVSTSTAWRLVQRGVSGLRESMAEYHTNGVNWKC